MTVVDTTPPVFSGVPTTTLTYEANSASGSSPNYTLPAATDAVDGPEVVTCTPTSGTLMPLGSTTVHCSATDTHGNTSTATFTINVVDTTPPVLTVPATLSLGTTGSALPASTPAIATFLGSAVAHDIVDPSPTVTNNAPATFPVGTTTGDVHRERRLRQHDDSRSCRSSSPRWRPGRRRHPRRLPPTVRLPATSPG